MEKNHLLDRRHSIALTGLFILGCFYTLYFARSVLLPIVVAILLNFLLAPVVRALKRIWIPTSVGALAVILVFLGGIGYGFYQLSEPAHRWLTRSPENFAVVSQKIESWVKPVENSIKGFLNIREQIAKTTQIISTGSTAPAVTMKFSGTSPVNMLFASTGEFFIELSIVFFILYFLLASGDFFLLKTVEIMPTLKQKKEAIIIAREIRHEITTFLVVKTLTGVGLAAVISVVMYFLQMPNPILWGVLAGVLEFIPYLGVIAGTLFVGITALFVFDNLSQVLVIPISFFTITSLTGNFIVPLILSRSLTLHPVIIFVGVIFGGWIWGITGALIAIPMLSILKIFCNNIESLSALGKFLGE